MTTVQVGQDAQNPGASSARPIVWFPLLWDLTGRRVVVVGGGLTAEAKILLLVEAGAQVTVVAPRITAAIRDLLGQGRVQWLERGFMSGDLIGASLAISATDNEAVNSVVFSEAETIGIPINAVDDPARCSVIFPAVHRDGPLVVAVSTSGAAPAVAVRLRDRIARLTKGYGRWLELLRGFRDQIRARFDTFEERRRVWYQIADSAPALDAARSDELALAEAVVQEVIDSFAVALEPEAAPTRLPRPTVALDPVAAAEARINEALAQATAPIVTCSMQLGGLVLLHLLRRFEPEIPVVFVDTGYHFPETLAFRDRVSAEWDLNLVIAASEVTVGEQETELGSLYNTDPARCCALRKIAPAEAVLADHDLWLAAVRRTQGVSRVELPIAVDHRLASGKVIHKVHPLADWAWSEVEEYAERHGIPRHPLYERGYSSIGCVPCTTPTFGRGDERSGRWDGTEMNECGLHVSNEQVGRA